MAWSLFKKKESDSQDIFNTDGEELKPLKFSNNKNQEQIVNDVLEAIKQGNKVIFIHGACGTGKSAIALNIAKNFKKTSIVVPIKSLQQQYEQDYTKKLFILKDDKTPLKISVIKGRANFKCPFANEKADSPNLPCTIELRERNSKELFGFIEKNPFAITDDFKDIKDIRRINIAAACPYWAPIMPSDVNPKGLSDFKKFKFKTISGKEHALFQRKPGCEYCNQYANYTDSDVLIFNSAKYIVELDMWRKPETDIEIIDECDEFLDHFANEKKININRLITSLSNLNPIERKDKTIIKELIKELNNLLLDNEFNIDTEKLEKTPFMKIAEIILENPYLAEDEEFSYYNSVSEIIQSFENTLSKTYIATERMQKDTNQKDLFNKNAEEMLYINMVSINLEQKIKELIDKNKIIIMMSGTIHSQDVLKNIFGLKEFKIIEAETKTPGEVIKTKLGIEKNCAFANFKSNQITREQYLKILDCAIGTAHRPTLVHVNAFSDLPTEKENEQYKFDNLITQEQLHKQQLESNQFIDAFVNKKTNILFTTKCGRGIDLADDKCRSIILTKYPYPNIQGLFWKILKKEHPEKFMQFYTDKARRELLQKIARGVRNENDWINLYSPDLRVLNSEL